MWVGGPEGREKWKMDPGFLHTPFLGRENVLGVDLQGGNLRPESCSP